MKRSKGFYRAIRLIGRVVLYPFLRTKYTNRNNIPLDGRYIITPNHISALDPVVIGIAQKRQIRFMGKAELFNIPVARGFFTLLGAFPVQRGKGDWDSINNAKTMIESGDAVGIFIEGTRSKTGELLRPKSGAVMLAHQMNCKLVPVSVCYRTKKRHLFSRIYVSFGEPVSTQDLGITDGTPREFRDASRRLMELIAALRKQDKNENYAC